VRVENALDGLVGALVGHGLCCRAVEADAADGVKSSSSGNRNFIGSLGVLRSDILAEVEGQLQLQLHVEGSGDGIGAVRSDLAEAESAVHLDRVFHYWFHGVEAHALVADLARLADDAVRQR
jgi:hypothetical protein